MCIIITLIYPLHADCTGFIEANIYPACNSIYVVTGAAVYTKSMRFVLVLEDMTKDQREVEWTRHFLTSSQNAVHIFFLSSYPLP